MITTLLPIFPYSRTKIKLTSPIKVKSESLHSKAMTKWGMYFDFRVENAEGTSTPPDVTNPRLLQSGESRRRRRRGDDTC